MAFLIPLSVNEDMSQVGKTNTVIFNEEDVYTDDKNPIKQWSNELWKNNRVQKENNSLSLGSGLLSHLSVENLECLTIKIIANWKSGCVVYWNEKYLHCSDNFIKNGVISKQALVIHTYVV